METSNYKITPVRKKRTKITLSAALVLCLLFFIVGILCGRAFSSNKQAKEATKQMQKMEQEFTIEKTRAEAEIKTYESEINRLKGELAEAKQLADDIIKAKEEEESEQAAEGSEDNESAGEESAAVEEALPREEKSSGGNFTRNLLIVIFVILIIVCVLFLFSIYFKKNDEYDEEDDYDEDDEYELEPTDYDDDFEDDFENIPSQNETEE